MQIKTTMRYHITPFRMSSSKRPEITSIGKDVEKRELLNIVSGDVNWYSRIENSIEVFKEVQRRSAISHF